MQIKSKLKYISVALLVFMSGCETTSSSSSNEGPECRRAKADNAFCLSDCLGSTPGGFLAAMGKCGNVCRSYTLNVRQICG